jgi:hypothetical protein
MMMMMDWKLLRVEEDGTMSGGWMSDREAGRVYNMYMYMAA